MPERGEEREGAGCAHSHLYLHLLSSGLSAAQRSKEMSLEGVREGESKQDREREKESKSERDIALKLHLMKLHHHILHFILARLVLCCLSPSPSSILFSLLYVS